MGFQIKNETNEILFQESFDDLLNKLAVTSLTEEAMDLKYDFGEASVKEIFFDGYHIMSGNAAVYQNLHVDASDSVRAVSLFFMIHGDVKAIVGNDYNRRFTSLEHNLYYNPAAEEKVDIRKQEGIMMLGVNFSKERFLQLAENNGRILDLLANNVAGDKPIILNRKSNHPITSRMLMVLDEIQNCRFNGGHKKLFLQSKVIELLALQCEQQEQAQDLSKQKLILSATDKEKIYFARDLLLTHLQAPLSLSELSKAAGINEFKLKNGFKQVFDNTVFGYLNDHKMEHARQLLRLPENTVTTIAENLGFSSVQHFSTAFRKKFGVSPIKLRVQ